VPESWDNVLGIVTRLWVGCSANPGPNPGTGNKFLLLLSLQTASWSINTSLFRGQSGWILKLITRPYLSADIKNDWLYTSTPHTPSCLAQEQLFIIHVNAATQQSSYLLNSQVGSAANLISCDCHACDSEHVNGPVTGVNWILSGPSSSPPPPPLMITKVSGLGIFACLSGNGSHVCLVTDLQFSKRLPPLFVL